MEIDDSTKTKKMLNMCYKLHIVINDSKDDELKERCNLVRFSSF